MFKHLLWKYRYSKFVKKWSTVHDRYKYSEYYIDLFRLAHTLDETKVYFYANPKSHITIYYDFIDDYLNACHKAYQEMMSNKGLKPRIDGYGQVVEIGNFFITRDGFNCKLYSGYKNILHQLETLVNRINQFDKIERVYYFNQLSEIFKTGVNVFETIFRDYSQ